MLAQIQSIDTVLMLFIQNDLRCGVLNGIMVFFSTLGNAGIVWIALSILMMITKKYRAAGFDMLLCIALCYCLNDLLIKNLVCRPRPFVTIPELTTLVSQPSSYSFPSGHACSSFAAAYSLTRSQGRRGGWFYIPASLIALSRPFVGVHYVSDVLVGAAVGTAGSAAVMFVRTKYFKFKCERVK